ncbi:MAG: DUF1538 domain-containing protein [Firmicutes bacterium]|nr:DUF1538 domain-containing protein [Bacillota bacterium]
MQSKTLLHEKLRESVAAVLPIALIVALLCFSVAPMPTDLMLAFIIGAAMLILGLGLFTFGAENSMTLIGNHIGAKLTKSQNLLLILSVSFLLGVIITIAEPDLQVLARNVPHIDSWVLIITVAVGVGMFLMISMLRIVFSIPFRWILLGFYILVFALAAFSDPNYLSVAFDSGGVTTGPMTVPFIMALGVGVASIRSDKNAEADSFGLVALCSIGPILAVLLLGFFYPGDVTELAAADAVTFENTVALGFGYLHAIPEYMYEVTIALAPIIVFFLIFNALSLKLSKNTFRQILVGLVYTFAGLVLFLTGVNVGFSSLGVMLGSGLTDGWTQYLLIPIVMLMGWFIVTAEPAIHVLTKQVEDISAGAISGKALRISLSIAIACAMGLAMVRVFTGLHIFWFVIPGYLVSLALMFFVPPIFTSIAFDSGGVASGPMTATFMLPFAMGACEAVGGNILTDAFGLVALVAMMPLITIQIMGLIYVIKSRKVEETVVETYTDTDVIELWEVK